MIKKKIVIGLITAMVMMSSLTACQKSGDEKEAGAGQTEVTVEETTDEIIVEREMSDTEQENNVSLEFLVNSPEYQACAEYEDFCEGYDTDFAILEQVGNEPVDPEYEYIAYSCYSPEMEKKIDEICEKYGLSKLSGFQITYDYSELCDMAEIGDFCIRASENVNQTVLSGYLYDGVFLMDGNAVLAGSSIDEVSYQFARVVKGYFTTAYLDFGDLGKYNIREYTTKRGEKTFFAISADTSAYIIAEREKSFIVINVHGDMSDITDVNDERLELLADAFDFSAIP